MLSQQDQHQKYLVQDIIIISYQVRRPATVRKLLAS